MPRDTRASSSTRSTRSSTSGPTRDTRGGGGGTRGGKKDEKKGGGFDWGFLSPPLWLAEKGFDRLGGRWGSIGGGIANAGQAINALPLSVPLLARHPKRSVSQAEEMLLAMIEAPYGIYKMRQGEGRARGLMPLFSKGKGGLSWQEIGGMFASEIGKDYSRRYGSNWEEYAKDEPFANLLDALAVLGAGARGASLAGAVERLGPGQRGLANIWRESSRPGLISEGEERARMLRFQPETGREIFSTQAYSRSPLRRYIQEANDSLAEKYATTPVFGARARIGRANANQLRRAIDRALGGIPETSALNGLSEAERTRLFWGAQMGDHSPEALRRLRDALSDEYSTERQLSLDNPAFEEWLADARKAGFGDQVVKRLDEAITVAEKGTSPRYERALDAMREATNLSEEVIRDAEGFTVLRNDLRRAEDRWAGLHAEEQSGLRAGEKLTPDELASIAREREKVAREIERIGEALEEKEASLEAMFSTRRDLLPNWLRERAADSPERRAWEPILREQLGDLEADDAMRIADRLANAIRPEDPASFWRDRVGMPTGESASDFRMRTGTDALYQPGVRQVVQQVEGVAEAAAGENAEIFYSPLQRWLANMPRQMPKQQLEATISKQIPQAEFYNAGLDLYFDAIPDGEVITREGFLNFLANPMNAYNLEERVLRLGDPTYTTRWHNYNGGSLLSRDGADGEYREIVMRLPGEGRDAPYGGEGRSHWGQENVIAHARFQVFEEDGIRKLLIEELQSDWASERRDLRRQGIDYHTPTDDEIREIQNLTDRREQIDSEIRELQRQRTEAELDNRVAYTSGDREAEVAARNQVMALLDREHDLIADYYDLGDQINRLGQRGVAPSPLGEKYYRALIRRVMREAAEENVDEIIFTDPGVQAVRNSYDHHLLKRDEGTPTMDMRADLHDMEPGIWHRLYGKDFPDQLAKEFGLTGDYSRAAYTGRYSTQPGDMSMTGDMPGTVFKMTDAAKAKALKPQSLYQRQPEWGALPKGATELLEGRTLIHMFEKGDISTWIHELGHSALFDLPDEQIAVLDSAFGGGRSLKSEGWTRTQHENYARAFERYFREGVSPGPELQPIFQRVTNWMKEIWKEAKVRVPSLSPEVTEVFDAMLGPHAPDVFIPHRAGTPNLTGARTSRAMPRAQREIGDYTASRIPLFKKNNLALMRSGLINDDPRTLVEHVNRVIMLARANQLREAVVEMAEPLMPDEVPDFETQYVVKKAGRGVDKPLFDALESTDDPEQVTKTIKDFMDEHITNDRQRWEAWRGESQLYVVDKKTVDILFKNTTGKTPGATTKPQTTATKLTDATLDGIRGLLLYANPGFYVANMLGNSLMVALNNPTAFRDIGWSLKQAAKAATKEDTADPLWHRISVEMGRGPTSGGLSMQPSVFGREGTGLVRGAARAARRPVSTARALKDAPPGRVGRGAEGFSHSLGSWGRRSGRVIDDSWRVMAWKAAARKRGYKTDAEIDALLDDAGGTSKRMLRADTKARRDLNAIRDEAEQLMLDFDSMTPFERTWLTRVIFLYPFLKASAKWPVMYAGERPITAGLLGQAALTGEQFATREDVLGPRSESLPAWMHGAARGPGGYWPISSVMPISAGLDIAQSALGIGQEPVVGINRPIDMANPLVLMLLDMAQGRTKFGQGASAQEILQQEFPAPAYIRYPWKKPSKVYAERDWWNALLRSLRGPFEVNEAEAEQQASRR